MKKIFKNLKEKKKGFTLIEMIIVIVIIGILAAAILPKILGAKERADDVKRIADLRNISIALEMYYQDNGEYPHGCGTLDRNLKIDESFKLYIKDIPSDPIKNNTINNDKNTTVGEYYYCALSKYGIPNNGYFLKFKALTPKSANLFPALRISFGSNWEALKKGLEKCPNGIKKGEIEDISKCQTTSDKFRYTLLSP